MPRYRRICTWALAAMMAVGSLLPASVNAGDLLKSIFKGPGPRVDPCVEQLANEIDWLERHIDQYGSVVCKQPDIWGQARLTKHRDEYEKKIFEQLNQFKVLLNGTLSREDQAFLANSFSLSAALGGSSRDAMSGEEIAATIQTSTQGSFSDTSVKRFSTAGLVVDDSKIALEPVIMLDQLSRYLNHLHELRRINEGDDTADSPGYSLNLVRMPVSLSPGRATREGYGAEVTITANPYLSDELLPITFRNLVINDLVDQLALPITKLVESKPWENEDYVRAKQLESEWETLVREREIAIERELKNRADALNLSPEQLQSMLQGTGVPDSIEMAVQRAREAIGNVVSEYSIDLNTAQIKALQTHSQVDEVLRNRTIYSIGPSSRGRTAQNPVPPSKFVDVFGNQQLITIAHTFAKGYRGRQVRWNGGDEDIVHLPDVQQFLEMELGAAFDLLSQNEALPIWSLLSEGGSPSFVFRLRRGDLDGLEVDRKRVISELRTAGTDPTSVPVTFGNLRCIEAMAWAIIVESALLNDHLIGDMKSIAQLRGCGCMNSDGMQFYLPNPHPPERQAFMEYCRCRWPIHVFALDPTSQDQNIADAATIRRELQLAVSLAFTTGKMNATNFTKFTRKFESDFQTIALNRTIVGFSHGDDTFGWRFYPRFQTPAPKGNFGALRETIVGPNADCDLLKRQIEPGPRECVAIVIMPSFVPYVTFDVRTNWFRLNHHNGLLPTRRHVEPSMTDTVKLSRAIKSMHDTAACAQDVELYRDGEVQRLLARVHQLDRELPLQTMMAQVPIENTLGGFEMFSNGVTDLAPNLYGWYGGPGILKTPLTTTCCADGQGTSASVGIITTTVEPLPRVCPCHNGTTLFLVGDHFSVHDTKVIAGDRCISDVTLLSRQIMRVTIPGDVIPNVIEGIPYVDVHVATPYGVTSHLHIPYVLDNTWGVAPPVTGTEAPKAETTSSGAATAEPAGSATPMGQAAPALVPAQTTPTPPAAPPQPAELPTPPAPSVMPMDLPGGVQPTPAPKKSESKPARPKAPTTPAAAPKENGDEQDLIDLNPQPNVNRLHFPSGADSLDRRASLPGILPRILGWRRLREPHPFPGNGLAIPVSYIRPLPPVDSELK